MITIDEFMAAQDERWRKMMAEPDKTKRLALRRAFDKATAERVDD